MSNAAELEWRDGDIPVSTRFDDPYFSLENGPEETIYVFLAGNGLPARFTAGFHIAELGFGTGLNFLVAWDAWARSDAPGKLRFTSYEAFPLVHADMARAHAAFPDFDGKRDALLNAWQAGGKMSFDDAELEVIIGDARERLPTWEAAADAWFLDGFSPAKNPELWSPELMTEVARHTVPGGTVATYTAAGFVRRGLEDAGFTVTRAPGFGRKRHMTRAVLA